MRRFVAVACLTVLSTAVLVATAPAATPVYKGTVGPGFTIKLAKAPKKAGKAKIVVADLSSSQLPPHRPGRQREDVGRRQGHEDVHGHAEEGHLHVRVRSAQELHEGILQDPLTEAVSGRGSIPPSAIRHAASSSRRTE